MTEAGEAPASTPETMIAEIIAEFSEVFAFTRARWVRYAAEVHPELGGLGMTMLHTIARRGPITSTELGQMLDIDKAVVSRQVTKLRQLELVHGSASEEDRRVTLLTSSPKAHESLDAVRAAMAHAYNERFVDWSEEDLDTLRVTLHRFNSTAHTAAESDGASGRHSAR